MGLLLAEASSTRRTIFCNEEFLLSLVQTISTEPCKLSVPQKTSSPCALSIGSDSPVRIAWFTLVLPASIFPSTGICSPGRMRMISPCFTFSAGICSVLLSRTRLAMLGTRLISFCMLVFVLAKVLSSKMAPSAMIHATSAAAKISPMASAEIMPMEISTRDVIFL